MNSFIAMLIGWFLSCVVKASAGIPDGYLRIAALMSWYSRAPPCGTGSLRRSTRAATCRSDLMILTWPCEQNRCFISLISLTMGRISAQIGEADTLAVTEVGERRGGANYRSRFLP